MTDIDDARLRADVEVVVSSLIRPQELDGWDMRWFEPGQSPDLEVAYLGGFTMHGESDPDSSSLWIQVLADGEMWWYGSWCPELDWASFLERFADQLADWISETSFGWGELRRPALPA